MFLQETTPDTSGYMIAGYVITFIILGIYIASMYLRNRNYEQDMTLLKEMEEPDTKAKPAVTTAKKPAKRGTKKSKK